MPSELLAVRYRDELNRLRAAAVRAAGGTWDQLDSWDGPDAAFFARAVAPVVVGVQRAAVQLTAAYLAREAGFRPAVTVEDHIGAAVRAGADPQEVYRRPFVTYWTALAAGKGWNSAVSSARARLVATAATDVQLAMRSTAAAAMVQSPRITGYRRTLTGTSCPLCQDAAGTIYRTDHVMPIHGHCDCGIAPVLGSIDPGAAVNAQLITGASATSRVREHDELGPVLTDAQHEFSEV